MRIISMALTTEQFLAGKKDVTRRCGWSFLKVGDLLRVVRKAMGLKKGEKAETLGVIEVVSVREERVDAITDEDVAREGFADWSREEFIEFFCRTQKVRRETIVRRIEFRIIELATVENHGKVKGSSRRTRTSSNTEKKEPSHEMKLLALGSRQAERSGVAFFETNIAVTFPAAPGWVGWRACPLRRPVAGPKSKRQLVTAGAGEQANTKTLSPPRGAFLNRLNTILEAAA